MKSVTNISAALTLAETKNKYCRRPQRKTQKSELTTVYESYVFISACSTYSVTTWLINIVRPKKKLFLTYLPFIE